MYFGHKHVEMGSNYSHELATSLKYHMTLSINIEKKFKFLQNLFKYSFKFKL